MVRKKYKNQAGSIGGVILDFIQSIVLAMAVFVLLYLFVAQPNQVSGSSMFPNFVDKQYLLTEKISYQMGTPQHGDVVVFKAPAGEQCAVDGCEYIKRVIGVPGDTVMVKNSQVYVNGQLLDQSFLPDEVITEEGEFNQEGIEQVVPEGQYLCFGDNREHSRDGREFGPINKDLIIGKVLLRYWPVADFGFIPKVTF